MVRIWRLVETEMIGRKQRNRVVYVDGIPIESNLLEAGDSGLKREETKDSTALAALDPRDLFDKYDTDGSGDIDLKEFKVLLHDLGVNLTEPKARAYFKRCDRRRRGCISFEEFRLALYTCDPKNPDRTGGFAPGQSLAPKDLFEMFDKDEEGAIDRETFKELLEFIGRNMPLDKMEDTFATYEDPELEMLPYPQFKKAWLSVVDVQTELRLRGERFNRFLPPKMLAKKLAMLVNLEEKQEAMVLLEANNTLSDEMIAIQRRELVKEARILARVTLAEALDAAGQVYVFGKGAYQRFDSEPMEPDFVEFMEYGIIRELWNQRVCPSTGIATTTCTAATAVSKTNQKQVVSHSTKVKSPDTDEEGKTKNGSDKHLTPPRTKLNASTRAFANRQVSKATAFLWGKRVNQVACGAAVAYALTDAGEVFCWGGNKRKWRYFYDEATASSKPVSSTLAGDGSGDPSNSNNPVDGDALAELAKLGPRRKTQYPLTARSAMLKLISLPSQVAENQEAHDKLGLRQKYAVVFEKPVPLTLTDEDRRRRLQLVGQYYSLLNPITSSGKPAEQRSLDDLMETVETDLNVDDLSLSLYIRGVELAKPTRIALLEALGECLELEIECVGVKFHEHMKQQDQLARHYRKERRSRPMMSVVAKANALWFNIGELRDKMAKAERERLINGEQEYDNMKRKITHATQKLKRRAREGHSVVVVAENNSNNDNHKTDQSDGKNDEEPLLYINGLTARGPELGFFNGSQALQSIAAGSRHALAIHSSGKLYAWGVGSFGRLGGAQTPATIDDRKEGEETRSNDHTEDTPADSWHRDAYSAQVIPAVRHLRFRAISCGFGHSLALSTDGTVYAWGSATHGKLGIGPVQAKESFTLAPMVLSSLTSLGIRVRKIACGPSHSALLTVDGALFVWGCGDGGRLGLGDGRDIGEDRIPRNGGQLRVIPVPTHVAVPFGQEKLVEVACGAAHTVVLTALQRSSSGQPSDGGYVYVAGSNHALNKFTPQFTRVAIEDASSMVMMTKVSCGPAHTALVSTQGELYTWGKNVGGSTGHAISISLIPVPTRVGCMFERPRNLCLDEAAMATQSSQNASAIAEFALGGDHAAREIQRRRQIRRASGRDRTQLSTGAKFSQTQQEICPFWQVALAERCRIVSIRIVLISPRLTESDSTVRSTVSTKPTRYAASAEGPKYVIMVSEDTFDPDLQGKQSLAKARGQSVHISLSGANQSELTWVAPADTFGNFVRVQLESTGGAAMLGLERVEVLGASSEQYLGPRVNDVVCAEGMTVAICMPINEKEELRDKFRRAVRADRANVGVLAQLETFHPFVREEVQQAKAEEALFAASQTARTGIEKREVATAIAALEAKQRAEACVLCRPKLSCVICEVEKQVWSAKRKVQVVPSSQPLTNTQPHHQQTMSAHGKRKQLDQGSTSPGHSTMTKRHELSLTLDALCAEFLALETRSKEEEEEEQKRLELELMDPEALARAKQEEEGGTGQISRRTKTNTVVSHTVPNSRRFIFKLLATTGLFGHQRKENGIPQLIQ